MVHKFLLVILFTSFLSFSQSKLGYWDNVRATNQTFSLKSGETKTVKSFDFPTGTTEVVVRITLLDENQKISSSLSSILKSIPDPTGISQGSAGAVFLASTIVGEDKCKYAIFTSSADAEDFAKTKNNKNACLVQDVPVNKDVKILNSTSNCISNLSKNIWISFESDNWIMNEKIVLEIVPWVDNKLSRGWNFDTKKELIAICNQLPMKQFVQNENLFCTNFLENISQKYTYKEFTDLLPIEKSRLYDVVSEEVVVKANDKSALSNYIFTTSKKLFDSGNKQQAIDLLQSRIFDKGTATASDYATLSYYYLLTNQFDKAEKTILKGIELDATELKLQLNLAHFYLFKNELGKAKELHKKYKSQNISQAVSWIQQTKIDFALFEKNKLPSEDFKKILKVIE